MNQVKLFRELMYDTKEQIIKKNILKQWKM